MQGLMIFLLITVSVFLILLIMIQRGKGGGLAGAFGGMGGQSAFGTKAGDTFTKITVWTALIWFLLCVITIIVLKMGGGGLDVDADKISIPSSGMTIESPTATPTGVPASSPTPANAPASTPAPAESPAAN